MGKDAAFKSVAMLARSTALCLGSFTLANLLIALIHPAFNANRWWIDLRPLPPAVSFGGLLVAGAAWIGWAIRPRPFRRIALSVTSPLTLFAIANMATFARLLHSGRIATTWPISVSLVVFAGLGLILFTASRRAIPIGPVRRVVLIAPIILIAFLLAQILIFGHTDYRRPADAIVVLGAKVDDNGRASLALHDRVTTACELYHDGYTRLIILSGGDNEPAVMKQICLDQGVPADAIRLDDQGITTEQTVVHTLPILRAEHATRILAVSHAYHLARVKLAYQQAGVEVFTVPAKETRGLVKLPWFVTREVAALAVYYCRSFVPGSPMSHS